MSFCCGASMIGTEGTLKHFDTKIHHVPLLFCPVCSRVEVHHLIEGEFEILADYASVDGAAEMDFEDYVELCPRDELYANCVNYDGQDQMDIVQNQIDMALDLLSVAKSIEDEEWQRQLKQRLHMLSKRRYKLKNKDAMRRYT